ncbi:MAG TPA: GGDEF domain-containing protein [Thermoanaerobaculia bacterium]|nr:GGDEF domain-containing protein [Thermoanaerobaculia bacterium]
MRTWAVAAGVAGYLVFAAVVWQLYSGDTASAVALVPCPGSATPVDATPPFYLRLERPAAVELCGSILGAPELLVLPRLSGNALEVRVDGRERLRVGSPERPANFWMVPQAVPLDGLDPGREHPVRTTLWGLYDVGVRIRPYVSTWSSGGLRVALLRWLNDDFIALICGIALAFGSLLVIFGFRRGAGDRAEHVLYGLTSLAASLYMLDFVPTAGFLSVPLFLARRKLSLAAAYFTVACLSAGIEHTTRSERRIGPLALVLAGILSAVAWLQPDAIALKSFSTWAAGILFAAVAWAVVLAVRRLEPAYVPLWVFFGCSALHTLFNLVSDRSHLYLLHWGLLAGCVAAGLRTTVQITGLAQALDRASRAALTDPLTGAWNRAHCERLRLEPGDSLAVLDFDDFKRVNDERGHERGDQLLVDFVGAARARLRRADDIVRLGGDEFALVLRGADLEAARGLCAEVVAEWQRLSPDLAPSASAGIVEVGSGALAFHELLAIADHRMYEQKQLRRAGG